MKKERRSREEAEDWREGRRLEERREGEGRRKPGKTGEESRGAGGKGKGMIKEGITGA